MKEMREADWQRTVEELCKATGWIGWHHQLSTGTRAGLPDLELLHPHKKLHLRAELKTARGVLSAEQVATLDLIERCNPGIALYVWRPDDLPEVSEILQTRNLAGPAWRETSWFRCRRYEVERLTPLHRARLDLLLWEYGLTETVPTAVAGRVAR